MSGPGTTVRWDVQYRLRRTTAWVDYATLMNEADAQALAEQLTGQMYDIRIARVATTTTVGGTTADLEAATKAEGLDEVLRAVTLLGHVAERTADTGVLSSLLPGEGTPTGPGSPYLTLLAVGGVCLRSLAEEWGVTVAEAVGGLRAGLLADMAAGDDA